VSDSRATYNLDMNTTTDTIRWAKQKRREEREKGGDRADGVMSGDERREILTD
jgi:hypothetical protein